MTAGSNIKERVKFGSKDWYQETLEKYHATERRLAEAGLKLPSVEPFRLNRATQRQVEAVRDLANLLGYKDLRGFWQYLKGTEQTYYDILKLSSPE